MKLFIILFVSILVLLIGIYFLTPLRYWNPILKGAPGHSKSITESKERGVYMWSYRPLTNPYIINDSIRIFVREAWLEHRWNYGTFRYEAVPSQRKYYAHQICISTDSTSLKDYNRTWSSSLETGGSLVLTTWLKDIPTSSREEFSIYQGSAYESNIDTSIVLGKLVFIKEGQ